MECVKDPIDGELDGRPKLVEEVDSFTHCVAAHPSCGDQDGEPKEVSDEFDKQNGRAEGEHEGESANATARDPGDGEGSVGAFFDEGAAADLPFNEGEGDVSDDKYADPRQHGLFHFGEVGGGEEDQRTVSDSEPKCGFKRDGEEGPPGRADADEVEWDRGHDVRSVCM